MQMKGSLKRYYRVRIHWNEYKVYKKKYKQKRPTNWSKSFLPLQWTYENRIQNNYAGKFDVVHRKMYDDTGNTQTLCETTGFQLMIIVVILVAFFFQLNWTGKDEMNETSINGIKLCRFMRVYHVCVVSMVGMDLYQASTHHLNRCTISTFMKYFILTQWSR